MRTHFSAAIVSLFAAGAARAQTTVYANTFDAPPGAEWVVSGGGTLAAGATGPACGLGVPFCGGYLGLSTGGPVTPFPGGTTTLTLSGLAAHSAATLRFDLLVLQSWDGNSATPGVGPDVFQVALGGGAMLLNTTFSNQASTTDFARTRQCYSPAMPSCPADNPAFSGAAAHAVDGAGIRNLGVGYEDAGYFIELTFPHTGPGLVLSFTGTGGMQGWPDEGWAIADVTVLTNAQTRVAPEPGTCALVVTGLLGVGAGGLVRGRQRRQALSTDETMAR